METMWGMQGIQRVDIKSIADEKPLNLRLIKATDLRWNAPLVSLI